MKPALLAVLLLIPALASAKSRHKAVLPPSPPPVVEPPLYPVRSTEPIVFVWPPDNMPLSADGEFIFGSVSPSTAHFTINGTTIQVHQNGGFIAWLPITPGTFTFRGELEL